jgi:hypothetical protein
MLSDLSIMSTVKDCILLAAINRCLVGYRRTHIIVSTTLLPHWSRTRRFFSHRFIHVGSLLSFAPHASLLLLPVLLLILRQLLALAVKLTVRIVLFLRLRVFTHAAAPLVLLSLAIAPSLYTAHAIDSFLDSAKDLFGCRLSSELPLHSQLFQIMVRGIARVLGGLVQKVNVIADRLYLELNRSNVSLQRLLGGINALRERSGVRRSADGRCAVWSVR